MRTLQLASWSGSVRYVEIAGAEPPIVFLTGLCPSSLPTFAGAALGIGQADGRRMLFIDPFGCGFSDAPRDFGYTLPEHAEVIAGVLEHAGAVQATLVGFSMGGAIATILAERGPPLVGQLVVVESNLDQGTGTFSPTIASMDEDDFERQGQQALVTSLRESQQQGLLALAGFLERCPAHAVHRSARALVEPLEPSLRERLVGLELPDTCMIRGGRPGSELSQDDAESLTAAGVTVRTVPDAGHMIMWDQPEAFAIALQAALQR